jgi:hypothetical protein
MLENALGRANDKPAPNMFPDDAVHQDRIQN